MTAPPSCNGWFGKIRALGDFVQRRLPLSFVSPWDDWLATELTAAREVWGENWAAHYNRVPALRFVLGAGVTDALAWHGVLIPSFDRIGRRFPLTIVQSRTPGDPAPSEPEWWARLAAAGRRCLLPDCIPDALDAELQTFFAQPLQQSPGFHVSPGCSHWWRWDADGFNAEPVLTSSLPRGQTFRELFS